MYETLSSGEMRMEPTVCLNIPRPTISALTGGTNILQKSSGQLKNFCADQYGMK